MRLLTKIFRKTRSFSPQCCKAEVLAEEPTFRSERVLNYHKELSEVCQMEAVMISELEEAVEQHGKRSDMPHDVMSSLITYGKMLAQLEVVCF